MSKRSDRSARRLHANSRRDDDRAALAKAIAEPLERRWMLANITGAVFNDINGDGTFGASPEVGLAGWTVFRDVDNGSDFDINPLTTIPSADVPKSIADSTGAAATTTSTLSVGGSAGTSVFDVNVTVNITHTYDQDLTLSLIGPNNVKVVLANQIGGGGDNFSGTTFDDEVALAIGDGAPPYSGTFKPVSPLSALEGISPVGTWTLEVIDNANQDVGTINSWSIQLTTSEPFTTTSATGSYSLGGVPAGTNQIGVVLQSGYQFTQPVNGMRSVSVGASDVANQNFGVRRPPGQVQGVKWSDLDGDGVLDAGEPGLANVRIYADLNLNGVFDSATEPSTLTAANGSYTIGNLGPGSYVIGEVVPANSTQTFPGSFGAATAPDTKSVPTPGPGSVSVTPSPEPVDPIAPASGKGDAIPAAASTGTSSPPALVSVLAPGSDRPVIKVNQPAAAPTSGSDVAAFSFSDSRRWSSTSRSGFGLALGDATKISWSIVPDGTPISGGNVSGEASAVSDLHAFLDNLYGSQAVWQPLLQTALNSWSRYSGITYVYEPNDDGLTNPNAGISGGGLPGVQNVRGDVRISGHPIDGNGNVLAYAYFPDIGDMVLDTSDSFYGNNLGNDSRALRNTVAHENGHGIGLDHVFPVNGTKLMEPFLNLSFDGVQFDDYLAANRGYGDPLEQGLGAVGPNNTAAQASDLGALSNGTFDARTIMDGVYVASGDPGVGVVSIDDDSDVDYFKFTVPSGKRVSLALDPVGFTYQSGSSEGAVTPFDAKSQSDLSIQLIAANGTTILASANSNGAGFGEQISNYTTAAGGMFFVQVSGAANAAQIYSLGLTVSTAQAGTWTVNVAAAQTVTNINFGNHVNGGVVNRLLFYNNSKYDNFDPAATIADNAAIATDKTALLPNGGPATFANYSSYSNGINGIMVDLSGIAANQTPTASDFVIQTGSDTASDPVNWAVGPAPTVTIRRGGGASGSDRVELTWSDAVAVKGKWMRVTVLPSARTGLSSQDVFYFGNAPGDTGNDTGAIAPVDAADYFGTRDHFRGYDNLAPITFKWDFNRDRLVDGTELLIVRNSATTAATALKLISPPPLASPVVAPKTTPTFSTSPVSTPTSSATSPKTPTARAPSGFRSYNTAAGVLRLASATILQSADTPALVTTSHRVSLATALVRSR